MLQHFCVTYLLHRSVILLSAPILFCSIKVSISFKKKITLKQSFVSFFTKKKISKKKKPLKRVQNRIAWNPGLKNLAWAETVREIKDYSTDRMLKTFPYHIFIHLTRSNLASMYLAKKKNTRTYIIQLQEILNRWSLKIMKDWMVIFIL